MRDKIINLYKEATGQIAFPYQNNLAAKKRLYRIFQTGNWRFVDCPFQKPEGADGMAPVWSVLRPLTIAPGDIPSPPNDFDAWIKSLVRSVAESYSPNAPYPLGVAQKTVNLFLKDMWAWAKLSLAQEASLHIPIDAIIYSKFKEPPVSWKSWTKVVYSSDAGLDALWEDYIFLQKAMKARADYLSGPTAEISPIMLEQLLWGGV
jgi:hypothetical protein